MPRFAGNQFSFEAPLRQLEEHLRAITAQGGQAGGWVDVDSGPAEQVRQLRRELETLKQTLLTNLEN